MADLLKNRYNPQFFQELTAILANVIPGFIEKDFKNRIYNNLWENLELKQRMAHIAVSINELLPSSFEQAVPYILEIYNKAKIKYPDKELEYMFLPAYIELFGLEHLKESCSAFEEITKFTSCEFAVRPFIIKYTGKMMDQMLQWAGHKHENVRRLASEGCRPRLPWAMALGFLKKDPSPIIPILKILKRDPSMFVRKSVANNINDISKDHPEMVLKLLREWKGKNSHTDWILKHGCRSLLKQGDVEALHMFGYQRSKHIHVKDFNVLSPKVKRGQDLIFKVKLSNTSNKNIVVRLEYKIGFKRSNGKHIYKVFQIGEKHLKRDAELIIEKKHSFIIITTRKYYPGTHYIVLIVNGEEKCKEAFELLGSN